MSTQTLVQSIIAHANMSNTQQNITAASSPSTILVTTTPLVSPHSDSDMSSATGSSSAVVINGREARNLAEKQRRDKLNASIGELAKRVPHVADSPRRLDKTAVLRLATHGLRLQHVFGKSAANRRRVTTPQSDNHEMTNALLQLLDSFFITLTCHGQIVLISTSVEHLLGHCQSDLYGQNLLQITHPEDQDMLRQQLIPSDIESLFSDYHNSKTATSLPTTNPQQQQRSYTTPPSQQQQHYQQQQQQNDNDDDADDDDEDDDHNHLYGKQHHHHEENDENHLAEIDEKLRKDKRCFTVRLARASTRSESKKIYEIVKIDGSFRRSDFSAFATGAGSYPIVSQLIRRSRNNSASTIGGNSSGSPGMAGGSSGVFIPHLLQHDAIAQAALHGVSGNDIVLVAMARIIRPPKIVNYSLEASRLEYKTRHLIDGRIIDCDHRIGLVAGYLKEEVRNLSPFSFMHQDDVRWVIVALRQMYDCNSDYGESCYRLLSRNGDFIYLNTKGYLEIDKGTNKVHSFVCVNTLLSAEEGKRKVQEMKNKFSIIINAKVPTNTMQDVPASQNPQQLERIVLYLIENLQKRQPTNGCVVDEIHSEDDVKRHTNTPPLALVPPETASVKNSISKSVSVVTSTAAKSFVERNNWKNMKESAAAEEEELAAKNEKQQKVSVMTQTINKRELSRPSVLQMRTKSDREIGLNSCSPPSSNPNSPDNSQSTAAAQHVSVLKRLRVDTSIETFTSLPSPILKEADDGDDEDDDDDIFHTPKPAKRTSINSLSSPANTSFSSLSITSLSPPHPPPPPPHSSNHNNSDDNNSDIHNLISSSLRDVGESLHCIGAQTSTLRQQCSSHNLPTCLDNKLGAIIIEQQKQSEFLVNIKNEYEVYKVQYHPPPNLFKNTTVTTPATTSSTATTLNRQQKQLQQQQQLSSPDIL